MINSSRRRPPPRQLLPWLQVFVIFVIPAVSHSAPGPGTHGYGERATATASRSQNSRLPYLRRSGRGTLPPLGNLTVPSPRWAHRSAVPLRSCPARPRPGGQKTAVGQSQIDANAAIRVSCPAAPIGRRRSAGWGRGRRAAIGEHPPRPSGLLTPPPGLPSRAARRGHPRERTLRKGLRCGGHGSSSPRSSLMIAVYSSPGHS